MQTEQHRNIMKNDIYYFIIAKMIMSFQIETEVWELVIKFKWVDNCPKI